MKKLSCEDSQGIGILNNIECDQLTSDFKTFSNDNDMKNFTNIYRMRENGLHFDEEVVVKDSKGTIRKVRIGLLENSWEGLKVLSINKEGMKFGSPRFLPIKKFSRNESSFLIKIRLADGRQIMCGPNLKFPKMVISIRVKTYNSPMNTWSIDQANAQELREGDNLLVLHKIPLSSNVPNYIFIPNFLNWENQWIGINRSEYLKFSYRTNQMTDDALIQLINSKFQYSKVAKIYRTIWANLHELEKDLIIKEATRGRVKILIKIHERLGHWYPSVVPLKDDFFRYLGWYVAEGHAEINRITITQSKIKNRDNWDDIINLLEDLDFPATNDEQKTIRINSNVLTELTIKLCSRLAENKKIPFKLFTKDRVNAFLNSYYKGDGNLKKEKWRRYSTISLQLKNDLVAIIGANNSFASVKHPSLKDNCYRIIETDGKHYKRKFMGLLKFNSTTPVKVKSIEKFKYNYKGFNLITENGWFASTNGIIVHDSI